MEFRGLDERTDWAVTSIFSDFLGCMSMRVFYFVLPESTQLGNT